MSDDVSRIRILIVDDHPITRRGLAAAISPEPDMEIVGSVGTGKEAIATFREMRPDVTIMDVSLTDMTGIEATQIIRREFGEARIIVLSAYQGDENIYRALQAGAVTYLFKESLGDELIPTLREVHGGGRPISTTVARTLADRLNQPFVTPRELEVLKLVAEGLRNKEIAGKLSISEQTTQGHVRSILAKLNVHDRTEAVTVAVRRRIIHLKT